MRIFNLKLQSKHIHNPTIKVCTLSICIIISDDWRCDQYRWFQNGCKSLPKQDPKVKKYYFNMLQPNNSSSNEFLQIFFLDNPTVVLIQYIGDNLKAVDFSHGNCKTGDAEIYIRTCS